MIQNESTPNYDESFRFFDRLNSYGQNHYVPDEEPQASHSNTTYYPTSHYESSGSGSDLAAIAVVIAAIGFFVVAIGSVISMGKSELSTEVPAQSKVYAEKGESAIIRSTDPNGANLRSDPNIKDPSDRRNVIEVIPNGTQVTAGEIIGKWQKVTLNKGKTGWVANNFVRTK